MKRLRLLIDMDSVLVDLTKKWFARYNSEHEVKMKNNDSGVVDFDFVGLSENQRNDLFSYLDEPGFFSDLESIPGSIKVLEKLSTEHEILIVTTPPNIVGGNTAASDKAVWLEKHCTFLHPVKKHLILTSRKDAVQGTLIFDDAPHNLVEVPGRLSVAMDYFYNRHIETDFRVYNRDWKQFYNIVRQIAKQI